MKREVAHYAEATKRNVVAAVRGGVSQNSISRRLGIPSTTVSQWVKHPRYSDVGPASMELMAALPPDACRAPATQTQPKLVRLDPPPAPASGTTEGKASMRITIGKLTFESESFSSDSIAMIIRALGDADVL